jgi:hypothetical protein
LTRAKAFFCLKKSWIPGQAWDDGGEVCYS